MRIVIAAILGGLADAGRYAGALQRQHQVAGIVRLGPLRDRCVERILVREPRGKVDKAAVLRPIAALRDLGHGAPFSLAW